MKIVNLSLIYAIAAALSLILLIGCHILVHKKRGWFLLLFSCVFVVNIGYMWLAVAADLSTALWANRLSYLGSVFLTPAMLMILLNVTTTPYKKRLPLALLGSAILMFFIAASPGVLDIYYKDVSLAVVNGVSVLVKVYGPLHPLYLLYLLGYFSAMVAIVLRVGIRKTVASPAHAAVLAIAVFVNIGVWAIEQLFSMNFEMLSISYIISELFLLGIHMVANENQRLRDLVRQVQTMQTDSENHAVHAAEQPSNTTATPEQLEIFLSGLQTLTPTEKAVFDAYIARMTTKEILSELNIKENTLKYHNRNLYGKLGVSSRKELLEMHKHLHHVKTTFTEQ